MKIPLITTREWEIEAAKLHYQYPKSYREKEMLVMSALAAKKAEELYV